MTPSQNPLLVVIIPVSVAIGETHVSNVIALFYYKIEWRNIEICPGYTERLVFFLPGNTFETPSFNL